MKKIKLGWFEWLAIVVMILSTGLFIYNLISVFGR